MKLTRNLGLVLIALALPLASCGTVKQIIGATVSQKQAAIALSGYNVAESAANVYLGLPVCAAGQNALTNPCKSAAVAVTLNAALDAGDNAADSLLADIKTAQASGSSVGIASAAYNAVIAATASVKANTPVS